jgi:hypothetical protein
MMSGCSRSLAVVAEPGRQAATYPYRKEQAIRIVILKTGMLSQALSLKPTHPPQPHIPTKATCAAHAEKCMIFVFCFRELKLRETPSPHSPRTALTGPMQASGATRLQVKHSHPQGVLQMGNFA